MKRNEAYFTACMERKVPISVKAENAMKLQGKTEQEQDEMREAFAREIVAKYPLKTEK